MKISPQFINEVKNERLKSEAYQISELLINDAGEPTDWNGQLLPWPDSKFDRCKNIAISNVGTSTLTNFPAYINLTYDSDMLSNYQDLRFYDSSCNNGGSLLNYEIENYTASNVHIWVRIPTLSTGSSTISVYYKNNTAVSSGQNATGVWDSNYKMVQHLKETSGTHYDSTSNGNNGTAYNGVIQGTAGEIDGADSFDGSDDYVLFSNTFILHQSTDASVEFWVKNNGVVSGPAVFWTRGDSTDSNRFNIWAHTDGSFGFDYRSPSGTWHGLTGLPAGGVPIGTWTHIAIQRVGNTYYLYVNGAYATQATDSSPDLPTATSWMLAGRAGFIFKGLIDEVRLSNTVRSADWIKQSYQMVANQNSYVSFGSEMTQPSASIVSIKRIGLSSNLNKTNLLSLEKITAFQTKCNSDYDNIRKLIGTEYYFSLQLIDRNSSQTLINCNPSTTVIKPAKVVMSRIVALSSDIFGEMILKLW